MGELSDSKVRLPAKGCSPSIRVSPPGPYCEAVILRSDVDSAAAQVFYGVVDSAVSERQLVCLQAKGAAQQLVAEADAENRAHSDNLTDARIDDVLKGRGSPGPFAKKTTSGSWSRTSCAEQVHGSRVSWQPRSRSWRTMLIFDARVDSHHPRPGAVETDRLTRADRAGEIGTIHRGLGSDQRLSLFLADLGRKNAARIAPRSRMWRTSALVSTPLIPGTPQSASQSNQPPSALATSS